MEACVCDEHCANLSADLQTRLGIMHDRVMPYFYLRRDKRLIADEVCFGVCIDENDGADISCPKSRIESFFALWPSGRSKHTAHTSLRRVCDRVEDTTALISDVQFILHRKDPCNCGSDKELVTCKVSSSQLTAGGANAAASSLPMAKHCDRYCSKGRLQAGQCAAG